MKKILGAAAVLMCLARAAGAAAVPDTGQTACYDLAAEIPCPDRGSPLFGQDAQHAGAARGFVKLDGQAAELADAAQAWSMVRDTATGLVWEIKNGSDGAADPLNPHDADNRYTWYDDNASRNGGNAGTAGDGTDTQDFIASLNGSAFGGFTDWRLPTARELMWVLDRGREAPPFIDERYFPFLTDEYWTATTDPTGASRAATVTLQAGMMNYPAKTASCAAMAVRGPRPRPGYRDNGDGTVCDNATGLMWQQDSRQGIAWDEGLSYCQGLRLAGHDDWRMPDINELLSIIDYSRSSPSVDGAFSAVSWHHWSSTTYPADPTKAYHVCFLRGRAEVYGKTDDSAAVSRVRAVRGPVEACLGAGPGKRPCLVNALYGPYSRQARLLQRYRDRVLAASAAGRALTDAYYAFSRVAEPLAAFWLPGSSLKLCIDVAVALLERSNQPDP
jgi:hypothetical protein